MQCWCQFKKRRRHSALQNRFLSLLVLKKTRGSAVGTGYSKWCMGEKVFRTRVVKHCNKSPRGSVTPLLLEILQFAWMSWPNTSLLSRVGARCLPKVPSTVNRCTILRNVAGTGLLSTAINGGSKLMRAPATFNYPKSLFCSLVHKRFLIHAVFRGQSFSQSCR